MGGLWLILQPFANPIPGGFSKFAHSGPRGGQRRVSGSGRCTDAYPVPGVATQGLKMRNTGRPGFELLWGGNFAPTTVGFWLLVCARFFLSGSMNSSPPMRASALRRRVLGVPFCLVHVFPRRLARGCVPRRRGAGAAPGCSRRCWSAGRCRWADPGIV